MEKVKVLSMSFLFVVYNTLESVLTIILGIAIGLFNWVRFGLIDFSGLTLGKLILGLLETALYAFVGAVFASLGTAMFKYVKKRFFK